MHLQYIRKIIEDDVTIQKYLNDNSFKNVKYSNFWFIVNNNWEILKHYIWKDFFIKNNLYFNFHFDNFYFQELKNYNIIKDRSNILIPEFNLYKHIQIPHDIYIAKIENIRNKNKKIQSFTEIKLEELAILMLEFHSIITTKNQNYIHWNIHPTNFFITPENKIWIFDFTSCSLWPKEQDLARIFIYLECNYDYFKKFLIFYWSKIDYKILLILILRHIKENIKYWNLNNIKNEYIIKNYYKIYK